jgi:acetyltransferase
MRVYDAAFRCAGLLRVFDLDELFAAAETLARRSTLSGGRLAILTNGGGVGVLAVDRLADLGGELAAISPETMKKLDDALPPIWSHANPADIAGDAGADRYAVALECLLEDDANDAVLVMNVPTALASALDAAKSVIAVAERARDSACRRSRSSPCGWAKAARHRKLSRRRTFPSTRRSPPRFTASCISCATGKPATC